MKRHDLYKRGRGYAITCLTFGKCRKEEFPDHFFCHACDMLEDAVINNTTNRWKPSREMKKYVCTGGHCDVLNPTTLKNGYRPPNVTPKQSTMQIGGDEGEEEYSSRGIGCITSTTSEDDKNRSKKSSTQRIGSPTKKKLRRHALKCGGDVALQEDGADGGSSSNDEDGLLDCLPRPNRLFSCGRNQTSGDKGEETSIHHFPMAVSNITPEEAAKGSTTVTTEAELSSYVAALEEMNARLNERLAELNSSHANLVVMVDALSSEIAQLKDEQNNEDRIAAADTIGYVGNITLENEGICDNHEQENVERTRRKRIQAENSELAGELSMLISNFISSSRLSDRRKYPQSRLAKIVVDSILSFKWTHSEVSKLSSHSPDSNPLSELSALLNIAGCRKNKQKAAILINGMWDNEFLDGEAQRCMIVRVREYLRTHVFNPWKILKAMDISGFNLSLAGIDVLRRVDASGRYERGIIPSKSTILRSARMVEAAADSACPFAMIGRGFREASPENTTIQNTNQDGGDFGEGFEFDAVKVTATLFEAFGLTTVAKSRPIELALTSDGAQLTNTLSHVAAGLKFHDMAMRDPMTKSPLLLHRQDSLVQSRNLCFPLRIVIAKDNKATLDGFRPLYNQFRTGEVATALQCRAFKMSFPGDMKLQWGALDDGGAAKVKEKFCYICPCRSSTLHVARDKSNCDICQQRMRNDDEKCYHYPFMADPEVRGKLAEELDVLKALVQDTIDADNEDDDQNQKVYVRRPGEVATVDDVLDIDFIPSRANDKAIWARNITRELVKRSLPVTGSLVDRQQRLRSHLVNELRCRDVSHMLAESEPKDQAMYLVLQAVVCILHLENRIGLKSIESILRSGISNARKGMLSWIASKTSVNRRQEEYVQRVTRIIRTEILGTTDAPSQWRFPLNEEGNMGTLSMDNNRTRSVMNSIEMLIVESFPNSDVNRDLLLRCFPRYRAAIVILRKNTDATDDEIAAFQDHVDAWFRDWVQVYGQEGCTNYTHMMSSSHVMRYMQEWKCLHRFSQQGWEALNALIKAYFFRRTNRGGLSKNSARKSKLLGIARWLQRRIMWYSGKGDSLFEDGDSDSSYEEEDHDSSDDEDDASVNGSVCTDLDEESIKSEATSNDNNHSLVDTSNNDAF